jgi:hypothetical protein
VWYMLGSISGRFVCATSIGTPFTDVVAVFRKTGLPA